MSEGDLGYWREVEKRYQKAKLQEIVGQHKENVELGAIVNELKDRLPVGLHDKVRADIVDKVPAQARDETFINAQVQDTLNAILTPYAEMIQRERKRLKGLSLKQVQVAIQPTFPNPQEEMGSRAQLRKFLHNQAETLAELRQARDRARIECSRMNCLLDPHSLMILSSVVDTWNTTSTELAKSDVQLAFFEAMPMEKGHRENWIRELLNGLSFTDSEIQEQNRLIGSYLSKL